MENGQIQQDDENVGILPRILRDLFRLSGEMRHCQRVVTRFWLSFFEIYNDQVYDLYQTPKAGFGDTKRPKGLTLSEEKDGSVTISNLLQFEISNETEGLRLLQKGLSYRAQRQTASNPHSSRSHAVFQLTMLREQMRPQMASYDSAANQGLNLRIAKLRIVDLAGSEKLTDIKKSKAATEELLHINKSLTTLGKCLVALNDNGSRTPRHIPFRESKLTRLLRDSLTGNSTVTLIACVSPSNSCNTETLATLKFAERAQKAVLSAPRLASLSGSPSSRTNSVHGSRNFEDSAYRQLQKKYQKLKEDYQVLRKENAQLRENNLSFCIPKEGTAHINTSSDTWASMQELCAAMEDNQGMGGTMKLVQKEDSTSLLKELEEFKGKVIEAVEGEPMQDLTEAFEILRAIMRISLKKKEERKDEFASIVQAGTKKGRPLSRQKRFK